MGDPRAAQIRAWLIETFGLASEHISDASPLFSSGMLDSFNLIELVAFIEATSGARVRTIDINLENFDSIEKIATYLARNEAHAQSLVGRSRRPATNE